MLGGNRPVFVSAFEMHCAVAMELIVFERAHILRDAIRVHQYAPIAMLPVAVPLASVVAQLIASLGVPPIQLDAETVPDGSHESLLHLEGIIWAAHLLQMRVELVRVVLVVVTDLSIVDSAIVHFIAFEVCLVNDAEVNGWLRCGGRGNSCVH